MSIQISILEWFFIDEKITVQESTGMVIAAIGAVLVQIKRTSYKQQAVLYLTFPSVQIVGED